MFTFRFNVLLTPGECKRAKTHLKQLWSTLKSRGENQRPDSVEEEIERPVQESDDESDEVESYIKRRETSRRTTAQNRRGCNTNAEIEKLLDGFLKEPRLQKKCNVLKYWVKKSLDEPILFRLAKVVLAVPATQVSVERLFSSLKFVLSPQRSQLAENVLNNVLVIRANKLFGADP